MENCSEPVEKISVKISSSKAERESRTPKIDALVPRVKERQGLPSYVMDIPIYCDYTSGGHQ